MRYGKPTSAGCHHKTRARGASVEMPGDAINRLVHTTVNGFLLPPFSKEREREPGIPEVGGRFRSGQRRNFWSPEETEELREWWGEMEGGGGSDELGPMIYGEPNGAYAPPHLVTCHLCLYGPINPTPVRLLSSPSCNSLLPFLTGSILMANGFLWKPTPVSLSVS